MARLRDDGQADERVRLVALGLMGLRGMRNRSDLAEPLGLTRDQVLDRFRGDKAFTVRDLARMAEFFGVDPGMFLAGPEAVIPAQHGRDVPTHRYGRSLRPVRAAVGNLAA